MGQAAQDAGPSPISARFRSGSYPDATGWREIEGTRYVLINARLMVERGFDGPADTAMQSQAAAADRIRLSEVAPLAVLGLIAFWRPASW